MNQERFSEELSGTVENVIYRNESNDYTVIEISQDDNLITAVGVMPMAFEGEIVTLFGHFVYHKEFGRQFAFDSYEKSLPKEEDGILRYLSSRTVKGVGPVTALKIVRKFGKDSFDVIENHPEWLTDIPGITMKKAGVISESFREQSGIRSMMMFCRDYLESSEITRVYKKLGASSIESIKQNPYILSSEEYSIPFEKADAIAKTLNLPLDIPHRIISAFNYILYCNATANGHTCLPKENLLEQAAALLSLPFDTVYSQLEFFLKEGEICSFSVGETEYIMREYVENAEKYVAKKLLSIEESVAHFSISDVRDILANLEVRLGIKYADLQKEAIYEALNSGVMILTGGPGTGKTTVIKAFISIFSSLGMKFALCAPTGRAAKRMGETTSHESKTVHRLLEMERNLEKGRSYRRNAKNPLDENVIIVDEASMLDLPLLEALLSAMRNTSRLILIGDNDQLPSVGEGNVFSDLINSGKIKTVRLTEIFRQAQSSLIVTNAHKINSGTVPVISSTDNDFFFVRRDNEKEIPMAVADLVTRRLPRTYGSFVSDRIQVITPSKKGLGGVEVLNSELQREINPPAEFKKEKSSHGTVFREGDKVMQIVNNYDLEWQKGDTSGYGIFNGDVGVIESINNIESVMLIRFDERLVEYPFENLSELELAYAITVHKSQGSEYPIVIIPLYSCAPMLMTRNLLYTAITRAKNMVILVGRAEVIIEMVNNNREISRYSTLKERIVKYYES